MLNKFADDTRLQLPIKKAEVAILFCF